MNNFYEIGNIKFTPEGGLAVRMINDTGAPTIKGYLIETSPAIDNGFIYTSSDDIDPMGVVYDDNIPDGEDAWVVVAGIAEVYYGVSVGRDTLSRVPVTADAIPSGQAMNEPLPSSPFATDKHFQEIGHPIEARVGPGLAKTVLHFN